MRTILLLNPSCYTIYATKDEFWTLHKPDRLDLREPLPIVEMMEAYGGRKVGYHPHSRSLGFGIKGSIKTLVSWYLLKGESLREMSIPCEAGSILPGIYVALVDTCDDGQRYVCFYVPEDGYDGKVPLDKLRYKYHYSVKE